MLYRDMGRTGDRVSALGYGCMRFPRKGGRTDEERTERQILSAVEGGVNYFDTAYIYPGSEAALGRILEKNALRDRVLIATKMPLFLVHSRKDMEHTLSVSLDRLRTGRIDYYLLHNLSSAASWRRLAGLGAEAFLAAQKQEGRVRRVGFSFHGDREQFRVLADAYPWDFCQIQYNILDENFQAGTEGLAYAAAKGMGVVVMEPLRGGLLSGRVPAEVQAVWDRAGIKRSPAQWALRWVWDHPGVSTVLSGMNEEAHIRENIRTASEALPSSLSEKELALAGEARDAYQRMMKVGCTGCGYCMPCPAGVDIPACFSYYNSRHLFGDKSFRFKYFGSTVGFDGSGPSYASLCRQCGKCERHCPQGLPIRKHLKDVAGEMESFLMRPAAAMARGYYRLRRPGKPGKSE